MLRKGDVTKNEKPRPAKIWNEHAAKYPRDISEKNEGSGMKDKSPLTLPGVQKTPVKPVGNSDQSDGPADDLGNY